MPELKVSFENFFKLIDDIENLKETFNCSYLYCNLNSDRLIISAKPPIYHHGVGDEEAKERYEKDKRSALTDAWLIERMLNSEKFRDQWAD